MAFAVATIQFCRELPTTVEGRHIGGQLLRAATGVGANYRAVCRARSRAEFIAKLGTVIEEADESDFWLELAVRGDVITADAVRALEARPTSWPQSLLNRKRLRGKNGQR